MPSYFLDTSALAKLYHQEAGSDYLERIVQQSGSQAVISRLSLVEMESVFAIKVRVGEIDHAAQDIARRRLRADVAQGRLRIGPRIEEKHYQAARKYLVQFGVEHALRTLDALQLAVALDLNGAGAISAVISADLRLCRVAEIAGCPAIDPANPGQLVV